MGWDVRNKVSVKKSVGYMGDATKKEGVVTRTADIEPRVAGYEIAVRVGDGLGEQLH